MKSLIFISGLLLITGCVGQQEATKEEMTHEYIVGYPSLSKSIIFDRTLKWIANNFTSAKAVIEYQDTTSGSIIGNGRSNTSFFGGSDLIFTMNLDIRNGRARYRFINLEVAAVGGSVPMPDSQKWHNEAKRIFDNIVNRLTATTNKTDNF